jgi:release factor glutamine methyltransferase
MVQALLDAATHRLRDAGIDTPRADAEWLLAALLGVGRPRLRVALDAPLPPAIAVRYEDAVTRRAGREPLQQILGWEGFRGLRIALTPAVMVPRPETETLVQWVLEMLPPPGTRPPRIADVGTGSGCIACSLAHERPDASVVAIDCSRAALAVARGNVEALGVGRRVRLVAADLLEAAAPGSLDLVVANLPYLPGPLLPSLPPEVREHEPRLALDGGSDGLRYLRRLAADGRRVLRADGILALETAGGSQAGAVAALLGDMDYGQVRVRADLAGVERFVAARGRGDGRGVA